MTGFDRQKVALVNLKDVIENGNVCLVDEDFDGYGLGLRGEDEVEAKKSYEKNTSRVDISTKG